MRDGIDLCPSSDPNPFWHRSKAHRLARGFAGSSPTCYTRPSQPGWCPVPHFPAIHLAFLICSIWLCRKLLCFTYLLATGSAAYHFRQHRSRHRRRNQRPPAAEGQALRGARLKALLALDFCLFMHSRSCNSFIQVGNFSMVVHADHLTVNMPLRILVGVHRFSP